MKFSIGGIFGKKEPVQQGPTVAGRTDFGGEFSLNAGESFVIEDIMLTNMGVMGSTVDFALKTGDREGRIGLKIVEPGSRSAKSWYEYVIYLLSLDQSQSKLMVKKACMNAKPITYDSDFWLKSGEAAAFEHGLILRNKSTSKSKQGEFTNVLLEMEYKGQKREATLVSFAKGKEKFVFAGTKNSANMGPFDIRLNSASDTEAALHVKRMNEIEL